MYERHLVCTPEQVRMICWKLQAEADCCTIPDSFQCISFSASVLQVAETRSLPTAIWMYFMKLHL